MVQFKKEKQREGTETKSAQATNIPHTRGTKIPPGKHSSFLLASRIHGLMLTKPAGKQSCPEVITIQHIRLSGHN